MGAGVVVVVAGCSTGGGGATGGEYAAAPKDLKAEITYGVWDQAQVEAIDANIEAFNKVYPDITVNVNVTPWASYWSKLQTQASSDTLPDLFWLNGPNFQVYAANGKIEPIAPQPAQGVCSDAGCEQGARNVANVPIGPFAVEVRAPFGADHVIAVAGTRPLSRLMPFLAESNESLAAADLMAALTRELQSQPLQAGVRGLYSVRE